jgi:phosphoglycerate dehydrogenase-like enzyme
VGRGRRIVVTDNAPPFFASKDDRDLGELRRHGEVIVYDAPPAGRDDLAGRLADADALVFLRRHWRLDKKTLGYAPQLRVVSFPGVGADHIDLAAAAARGVLVCNVPGASAISVAEHALGLCIAVARSLPQADRDVRSGAWAKRIGVELHGKTMGLLGLGAIGSEMARLAKGVGMRVVAWSFHDDPERAARLGVSLAPRDEVFARADVLSVHLRASPDTQRLVSRRELGLMKRGAIFINTARGTIVDQDALLDALRAGHLAGAGLDVFAQEPLGDTAARFADLPNVVLTPHMADETEETNARLRREVVANVIAFFEGRPRNVLGSR